MGLKKRNFLLLPYLEEALEKIKILKNELVASKMLLWALVFFIFAPSKKLNSSLSFHQISPQKDLNENLFIVLWEYLRICNCLKAKFWENRYSKLIIFIQDVFFFGHPLKNWIARSFFIGFRPKMTSMKIHLYYFEKI